MVGDATLQESWYVQLGDYIIDLEWSPEGDRIAAVTVDGSVFLITDHGESSSFVRVGMHEAGANSVSWRRDSEEFATGGQDGRAIVWDGVSGNERASLDAGDSWVAKTTYNPKSNVLATAAGRHLKLWDDEHDAFYQSADHASTIADLGWHPNGSKIAAAAYNGVTMHAPRHRDPRKYTWKGSSLVLAWSPTAKYIATGEQDSTVHFWHVASGKDAQMWGFDTKVLELSWSPGGRWLATGGGDSVCLWDCSGQGPAGRKPRQYNEHASKLTQVAFQPDGNLLASSDVDAFLLLWDPLNVEYSIGRVRLTAPVSCMRWRKGGRLAVGQNDGTVVLLTARSQ